MSTIRNSSNNSKSELVNGADQVTPREKLIKSSRGSGILDSPRPGKIGLKITVVGGLNLPAMDSCGTSDPYVVLKIPKKEDVRTSVKCKTCCPVWNETFKKNFQKNGYPQEIIFEVYDSNKLTKDVHIGTAKYTLTDEPLVDIKLLVTGPAVKRKAELHVIIEKVIITSKIQKVIATGKEKAIDSSSKLLNYTKRYALSAMAQRGWSGGIEINIEITALGQTLIIGTEVEYEHERVEKKTVIKEEEGKGEKPAETTEDIPADQIGKVGKEIDSLCSDITYASQRIENLNQKITLVLGCRFGVSVFIGQMSVEVKFKVGVSEMTSFGLAEIN